MNLFEIGQEFHALQELLEQDLGEETPEYEQLKEMALNLASTKTDGFVSFIQKLESEAEVCASNIKRLQEAKRSREAMISRLKDYCLNFLESTPEAKMQGVLGSISLRKGVESVSIIDINELSMDYIKTVIEPKKDEIKKALKNGENVIGATLVTGRPSVMIKLKAVK